MSRELHGESPSMRVLMFGWEFPPHDQRRARRRLRGARAGPARARHGGHARPAAPLGRDRARRTCGSSPAVRVGARREARTAAAGRRCACGASRASLRPYMTEPPRRRGAPADGARTGRGVRRQLRARPPARGPALRGRGGAHRRARALRRHPRPRLAHVPRRARGAPRQRQAARRSTSTRPSSTARAAASNALRRRDRAARPRRGRPRRRGLGATRPSSSRGRTALPAERLRVVHNAIDPRERVGTLGRRGGRSARALRGPDHVAEGPRVLRRGGRPRGRRAARRQVRRRRLRRPACPR